MFGRIVLAIIFQISFAALGRSQDPNATYGGFCPPGSTPAGGGGYTCVCPDGSLAGINGCSGSYQPPQQQGNYCPTGGTCPFGTTCCGNLCCKQGSKCSPSGGCIPQEANDCGDGHWCNSGTQCWTAPSNIGSIRQGELKCVTPSQAADLQRAISEQLAAERNRRLADENDRRRLDEQSRIEARRRDIEGQLAEARKKLEQTSLGQKQATQQLQRSVDQQRQATLQRMQKPNTAQPQGRVSAPETCAIRQINAIAVGANPDKVICGTSEAPPTQSSTTKTPTTQDKAWADQLDYLKRNAVRLQPEERRLVTSPGNVITSSTETCRTTFMCGTPPNQYTCPCSIEAAPPSSAIIGANGKSNGAIGPSPSGSVEFQASKFDDASLSIGTSRTYSLRAAQGQVLGVNARLSAVQLQGMVSAGLGTNGASIEVKGSGALLHGEATHGGTTATLEAGAGEVRASGGIGPQGVSGELGAGAYLIRGRVDQSFAVAGFQIGGYAQAGIGVEAKSSFAVGARDDKIQLGLGPVELGLDASKN